MKTVRLKSAYVQHSHQMCSSASSMPTKPDTDDEEIPELVKDTPMQVLYPPTQSQSDKEADWEVITICSAPVYYRVRSLTSRQHRYYMYNVLDAIEECHRGKRRRPNSPHEQGPPVEH